MWKGWVLFCCLLEVPGSKTKEWDGDRVGRLVTALSQTYAVTLRSTSSQSSPPLIYPMSMRYIAAFLGGFSSRPGRFAFGVVLPKDRDITFIIPTFKTNGFRSTTGSL